MFPTLKSSLLVVTCSVNENNDIRIDVNASGLLFHHSKKTGEKDEYFEYLFSDAAKTKCGKKSKNRKSNNATVIFDRFIEILEHYNYFDNVVLKRFRDSSIENGTRLDISDFMSKKDFVNIREFKNDYIPSLRNTSEKCFSELFSKIQVNFNVFSSRIGSQTSTVENFASKHTSKQFYQKRKNLKKLQYPLQLIGSINNKSNDIYGVDKDLMVLRFILMKNAKSRMVDMIPIFYISFLFGVCSNDRNSIIYICGVCKKIFFSGKKQRYLEHQEDCTTFNIDARITFSPQSISVTIQNHLGNV